MGGAPPIHRGHGGGAAPPPSLPWKTTSNWFLSENLDFVGFFMHCFQGFSGSSGIIRKFPEYSRITAFPWLIYIYLYYVLSFSPQGDPKLIVILHSVLPVFFGDLLLWKKPILEVKQNNTKETNPHAEDNKQSRGRTRMIEDEIYETLKESFQTCKTTNTC